MGTITDQLQRLAQTKAAIKAAIIRMGQSVGDSDPFSSYADKITAIKTGVDTSDATAGAGDILSGKAAYSKGQRIEGTIPSKGADSLSVSGATVTVPAGYYPSAVSKAIPSSTISSPAITINEGTGLITASISKTEGYVGPGGLSTTHQLPVQGAATITPTAYLQMACSAGRYTTGNVTVAGDVNLAAQNIKSGVSIFGVAGTAEIRKNVKITATNNTGYTVALKFAIAEDMIGWRAESIEPYQTKTVSVLKSSHSRFDVLRVDYNQRIFFSGTCFSGAALIYDGTFYNWVGDFSSIDDGTLVIG